MATWRPFLIKIGTGFFNFLEISKKLILCVNLRYFGQLSVGLFWVCNIFSILSRKLLLLFLLLLLYNNVRPFKKKIIIIYYFFCLSKWVGRVTFPLITLLFVSRPLCTRLTSCWFQNDRKDVGKCKYNQWPWMTFSKISKNQQICMIFAKLFHFVLKKWPPSCFWTRKSQTENI